MGDWSENALVEAGVEDTSAGISGFALTAAFAFYGVTIGFILAGNSVARTLLSGKHQPASAGKQSDISTYNLVDGTTSIRALFGRGVGIDTTLIIGESEEESQGGSTIIEVTSELHNDEVDEFPVSDFDEDLVVLTKWLCGRGTTTAQFFSWADVDDSGEVDMFEFSNALKVADIADLPPWDVERLVGVMDINSDGQINLPELDIALLNIRNKLGIEFIPFEEEVEEEVEEEAAEEESDAPSAAEMKKMKKAELVDVAKSMGLSHTGTKANLIERITQA
jgi:hypothetical protein